MANAEHLKILKEGVEHWNSWRKDNSIIPDLSGVDLSREKLSGIDLSGANLSKADFSNCMLKNALFVSANLSDAYFLDTNLYRANLSDANLNNARMVHAELLETNLSRAKLNDADLSNANLYGANFTEAELNRVDLSDAKLTETNFTGAILKGANLSLAICVETNFTKADIDGARVYGVSAWKTQIDGFSQKNLIITRADESDITVDNIEVAQLFYLILNNKKLRDVIGTIAKKGVLILGRFTPERKKILYAIRDKLRENDFLPIMFDFERPSSRDLTETIKILAGMSNFIIVDISEPKSVPLELQAIVPDYKIPFLPIIQKGETPFSMFNNLRQKYNWVLPTISYSSEAALMQGFKRGILDRALVVEKRLFDEKQAPPPPIEEIESYID